MAKAKSNLAGVLDGLPPEPTRALAVPRASRSAPSAEPQSTVLVGANLPPAYARNLALLHAETGRSKKELLQEALDMLFRAKGGAGLRPTGKL